jgi:hypothetical protein
VRNYLIKETQLRKIMEVIELEKEMTLAQAMRKIISVLREDGFDDEQAVDFMIGLRHNDPFIKQVAKKFDSNPDFIKAVERLGFSVDV